MNEIKTAAAIELPKIPDERGNLSFLENGHQIPFNIKRVQWIFNVPAGEACDFASCSQGEEFILALSGSLDLCVGEGGQRERYHLNRSNLGVYVPAGCPRKLENFSTNAIAAIVSSQTDANAPGREPEPARRLTAQEASCSRVLNSCCLNIEPQRHPQRKGDICVVNNLSQMPFDVKRVFFIYDVPAGAFRGGHAHKELYQLIVAVSGSFTVRLDDGDDNRSVTLNRPYQALLVEPGIWSELNNFSSGSVCLVLASDLYDASDYLRRYDKFLQFKLDAHD